MTTDEIYYVRTYNGENGNPHIAEYPYKDLLEAIHKCIKDSETGKFSCVTAGAKQIFVPRAI
jgi:hypothetical protein